MEKKVVEDEQEQIEEDEEKGEQFQGYGIESKNPYKDNKGAYHAEQPYEKDHDNQTGYENKQ